MKAPRPTREQLLAATGKTLPDVIAPGLKVLFCGINPGLYSAAVGHHFARPGNRFWPALHPAGFTGAAARPFRGARDARCGYGITNVVDRGDRRGGRAVSPTSWRRAGGGSRRRRAVTVRISWRSSESARTGPPSGVRRRPWACNQRLSGTSRIWVLPNPSGLNAHYQRDDLARMFRELRLAVEG